ncbi:MAG: pseudouridine synthase [Bacteroidales bacterium]
MQKSSTGHKKYRGNEKKRKTGIGSPRKPVKSRDTAKEPDEIRLNKYIAGSGLCSRREADEYIKAGLIRVNGKTVTQLGTKVKPTDDIRYNNARIRSERLVYVLLNKPKDYITTLRDPFAKKTVLDLVQNACKERIFPVGRLDRNTTGVLLLTNDGELTKKLTHPSHNKVKVYHVTLNKSLSDGNFQQILKGVTLEDGVISADGLNYIDNSDKKQIGIELHSGRNRIVRRLFNHLGYDIKKLDRVYFAGLTKKGLPRGKWRFLSEKEVNMLKIGAYK